MTSYNQRSQPRSKMLESHFDTLDLGQKDIHRCWKQIASGILSDRLYVDYSRLCQWRTFIVCETRTYEMVSYPAKCNVIT